MIIRAALWALRSEFLIWVFGHLSGSGVWRTKVKNSPSVETMTMPVFWSIPPLIGGIERRASNVMFEFFLAARGGASEFASANLGVGSPRGK